MSQPYDCQARVPSLRTVDNEKGEFWVSNPWLFSTSGENLSCYETNGVHLNAGGGGFLDMSYVSGADSDGDGRSVVAWDLTGDGMPELLVRQAGGGALVVYRNRFPKSSWLKVSLRGTRSNSLGIGSKVIAEAGGRRVCRELYPIVNFLSQSPAAVHIGLGDAKKVDRLTVRWPSGEEQVFVDLEPNWHVLIREGSPEPRPWPPAGASGPAGGK
ncbi:MAG: ASPIC/UnbV domain-containing protein [Planctomycetes bacterium]|nr:ASPIC/UnbV domain-containing protein [Planctomycetota bacterium]